MDVVDYRNFQDHDRGEKMLARIQQQVVLAFRFLLVFTLFTGFSTISVKATNHEEMTDHTVTVILQREYLDGELSEETLIKQNTTLEDEYDFYLNKGWELVSIEGGKIVFKKYVQDLSPLMKMNGYFNTAYIHSTANFKKNGEKRKIVQSFFQIVLEKMETRLPDLLVVDR